MFGLIPYFYLLGLLLSVIFFVVVLVQKPSEEQNVALLVAVCCGLIWAGYWLELKATSLEDLIIAKKINYLGACNVYLALILFYIRYYNIRSLKKLEKVVIAISTFFTLATLTLDKHPFYYQSFAMDDSGPFPELVKVYGPLHDGYILMVLFYTVFSVVLTIKQSKLNAKKKHKNINESILLSVIIVPTACYLAEKIMDLNIHLVPFGLLFTDIALIYLIAGNKITDINILAKEFIYETIDDAIIVLDIYDRYRGANKLAKELFPALVNMHQGEELIHFPEEVRSILCESETTKKRYLDLNGKVYAPKRKEVRERMKYSGNVWWFEDVTAQRNNMMLIEHYQLDLEKEVNRKTAQLQSMQIQMINGFSAIVENKNLITGNHIQRTSGYVEIIARELYKEGVAPDILKDNYMQKLKMVAPLHDIGKVSIPEQILDKPAKLTTEEFEVIKTHSANGAKIIDSIMGESEDKEYLEMAKDVAIYHHEKWNGGGYPEGLSEEDIPLSARIMAVADVFDALVSARPYKGPYSLDEAFEIIKAEKGKHFDPKVVDAFLATRKEIEELYYQLGKDKE